MSTEPGVTEGEEILEISNESTDIYAFLGTALQAAYLTMQGHRLEPAETPDDGLASTNADIALVQKALAAARAKGENV